MVDHESNMSVVFSYLPSLFKDILTSCFTIVLIKLAVDKIAL